jgi:hypothetical protein
VNSYNKKDNMSGGQNVSKTGGTNKVSEKKVFSTRSNHISLGRNNKRTIKRKKKKKNNIGERSDKTW